MDRIIYVVPFTSIIKQNAQVFRDAIGEDAVLEHHSGFDEGALDEDSRNKLRHVTASWDAPVIVTTAVQFFESLFADRPGKCKKLPSIANAVIVLDEAQTLPLPYLRPCVAVLGELVRNYRSSVVLCTATQPVLGKDQGFQGGLEDVREIAPEPERLYRALKRVSVAKIVELDEAALVARLSAHEQVLCIVDTRNQARDVAERLGRDDAHFHLSLNMCAKHRSLKLAEIRERLAKKLPCRVVSTSLIEAGVDVDFPAVYRAETGLDQLAQAAGRCNRNGERDWQDSVVQPFRFPGKPPVGERSRRIRAAQDAMRRHDDPLGLAALRAFFEEVYWSEGEGLDKKDILSLCEARARAMLVRFAKIAAEFKMIEEEQRSVIVPFDAEGRELLDQLAAIEKPPREIMRPLQRHVVTLWDRPFCALVAAGSVQRVGRHEDIWELVPTKSLYRDDLGLTSDDPTYRSATDNIIGDF